MKRNNQLSFFAYVLLWVMLVFANNVYSQQIEALNAEELFSAAREKAFSGNRMEARVFCLKALEKSPSYDDIKIFYARVCYWDNLYDSALIQLEPLLKLNPNGNIEGSLLLVDINAALLRKKEAYLILDTLLLSNPNNIDVLVKKANLLEEDHREKEAVLLIIHAIEKNPSCSNCISLFKRIKLKTLTRTVAINTEADYFSKVFDPMYFSSIQFRGITKFGTILGRVNYTNRFGSQGLQIEGEAYPKLWKGAYSYLNYGFSGSELFAKHRVGIEFFQSLPYSMEISSGLRHLLFNSSNINVYTFSLGIYKGNYWISGRTYLTPSSSGLSNSYSLTIRRYLKDGDNYFFGSIGSGFSPDTRRIQSNDGQSSLNNIYYLKSQQIETGCQINIRYNLLLNASIFFSRQQTSFSTEEYINSTGIKLGFKLRI